MNEPQNSAKPQEELAETELDLARAIDAFAELYQLLEEYAPPWYSEEVHDRAQAAPQLLGRTRALRRTAATYFHDCRGWKCAAQRG